MKKKFYRQKNASGNVICVAQSLLAHLNVRVSAGTVATFLKEHPDYPSMNAVSDLLEHLKVESMAVQIEKKELKEVEFPAIAYLTKNNGHFVMLTAQQDGSISYFDPETGMVNELLSDFEKKWHGILLLAGATEQSGDPDYEENQKSEQLSRWRIAGLSAIPFILLMLSVISGFSLHTKTVSVWLPLLLAKAAGSVISILLILSQFHDSSVISRFCNLGKNMSCSAVLRTSLSKVFSWLSLSELGAFYFIGGLLGLMLSLFSGDTGAALWFFAIINLPALPFTFYSVYYQAKVVKQWCPLCLMTMLLFWIEFFILLPVFTSNFSLWSISELSVILFGFALPVLVWAGLKPAVMADAFLLPALKKRLEGFTRNPAVFTAMLSQQPPIQDTPFSHELIIGNAAAPVKIIMGLSPFCKSCATAYGQMTDMVSDFPGIVHLVIRFIVNREKEQTGSRVALPILGLLAMGKEEIAVQALDKWYKIRDENKIKSWLAQFPPVDAVAMEQADTLLKAHSAWADRARIARTPMYFINERPLAAAYDGKDIRVYLKALAKDREAKGN